MLKRMACLTVALVATACLAVAPSAVHASEYIVTGTQSLAADLTVDGDFWVGDSRNTTSGPDGTLNHTAGTLTKTSPWGVCLGFGNSNGTYNMSGDATLAATATTYNTNLDGNSIWTLTDNAKVDISNSHLNFTTSGTGASYIRLSGSAQFDARKLTISSANDYITFDSGCLATLTISDKVESDYQSLVSSGYVRIDGVTQSDFSKFQVSDHTLSLAVPEPSTTILALTGIAGLLAYAWRKRKTAA